MRKVFLFCLVFVILASSAYANTVVLSPGSDIGQEYIYNDPSGYSGSAVSLTYDAVMENFHAVFDGSGLKPGFTYQVKLFGTPTCAGGSDATNERIGFAGRWFCPLCPGDSNAKNRNDAQYLANKAKSDSDPTKECIYGYLIFSYLTSSGTISDFDVSANRSYHVLRCGASDSKLYLVNKSAPPFSTNALKCTFPKLCNAADVVGDLERPSFNSLPSGDYQNVHIVLTEESFHQSCGTWANVLAGDLSFTIQPAVPQPEPDLLDEVNIGDLSSESGHNVTGWSSPDWNTAGCYGGGDDQTLRTVLPRSPECTSDDKISYFTLSTDSIAEQLKLRHLIGSENDAYELYVKESGSWVLLSPVSSSDQVCGECNSQECWYTDLFNVPNLSGKIEFKVVALTIPTSWCADWGLNAFSWAKLFGSETPGPVPEFGAFGILFAVFGGVTGFFILKKR
ncbi:MAG: hypothetical protein V1837_04635 [Candidatus Woesearchaeota archaeon]